jgi:hypothetical protein
MFDDRLQRTARRVGGKDLGLRLTHYLTQRTSRKRNQWVKSRAGGSPRRTSPLARARHRCRQHVRTIERADPHFWPAGSSVSGCLASVNEHEVSLLPYAATRSISMCPQPATGVYWPPASFSTICADGDLDEEGVSR